MKELGGKVVILPPRPRKSRRPKGSLDFLFPEGGNGVSRPGGNKKDTDERSSAAGLILSNASLKDVALNAVKWRNPAISEGQYYSIPRN